MIIVGFVLIAVNRILPSGLPYIQVLFGTLLGLQIGKLLDAWRNHKESSFDFRREKTQELLFLCSAQLSQVITDLLLHEAAPGEGSLEARHIERVRSVVEDYDVFTHALHDSSGLPEELRHLAKVFPRDD